MRWLLCLPGSFTSLAWHNFLKHFLHATSFRCLPTLVSSCRPYLQEFDMNSILKAESAMLAAASAVPEEGSEFFAVSAAARHKPTTAEAREEAARIVMADMEDEEGSELDEDEDEDDNEDDDDEDDEEDGEDDDDAQEESDEPMVKAPAKRVGFAASTKPPAVVSVKKIGNAVKAGKAGGSRGSYDFKTHFTKRK
jgi:hypothetical protein